MVDIVSKNVGNKKSTPTSGRPRVSDPNDKAKSKPSIAVFVTNKTSSDIVFHGTGVALPAGEKIRFLRSVWSGLAANIHVASLVKTKKIQIT